MTAQSRLMVVIPTFERCDLLDRTLQSLTECSAPSELSEVIVAENGPRSGAESIVRRYSGILPVKHCYSEKPNKSHALNCLLRSIEDDFVVFFDDDVRLDKGVLAAYAEAASGSGSGRFFCGRCFVDYEESPPSWLRAYLPPSATGWGPGDKRQPLTEPDGMGFNWGAYAVDMKAAGGFDERRGPGSASRGQESDMQRRLLARGVAGVYLPEAQVWHYVPKNRCSPEWALNRVYQMGVGDGIQLAEATRGERLSRLLRSWTRLLGLRLVLALGGGRLGAAKSFHYRYRMLRHQGLLNGAWGARGSAAKVAGS